VPCLTDLIEEEGQYQKGDDAAELLRPFFERVFDQWGYNGVLCRDKKNSARHRCESMEDSWMFGLPLWERFEGEISDRSEIIYREASADSGSDVVSPVCQLALAAGHLGF